jgi:predicted ATPase
VNGWLCLCLSAPEVCNTASAERLVQWPAVQLFVDRAQAVRPDFQVTPTNAEAIAELCERLEGIPLAIELVAARAGVMTPRQMLSHLTERLDFFASRQRHVAERHRTLRSAVSWSFRLLPLQLQQFFSRLAFFHGGWTWQAAQVVCENAQALDDLEQLREYSLVGGGRNHGGNALSPVGTLREYAAEQVTSEAQEGLQRRTHFNSSACMLPHISGARLDDATVTSSIFSENAGRNPICHAQSFGSRD